jgi:hypothetical protein
LEANGGLRTVTIPRLWLWSPLHDAWLPAMIAPGLSIEEWRAAYRARGISTKFIKAGLEENAAGPH